MGQSQKICLMVSATSHSLHSGIGLCGFSIKYPWVRWVCQIRRRDEITSEWRSFCVEECHKPTVGFIYFSLLVSGSLFHIICHLLKMLDFRDDKISLTGMLIFDLGIVVAAVRGLFGQ